MSNHEKVLNDCSWGSRRAYLTAMMTQVVGIHTYIYLPHRAVNSGAVGYLLMYILVYITLGIPLFYMEQVVGQFTARDCVDVWRARGCLSHLGYIHVFWQTIFIIYCHTVNASVLHYFLISFEDPIPYYTCGFWSDKDCNILKTNYTINQDCIRSREPLKYCGKLYTTYPEYQYWRYYILGMNRTRFHLAWRVGLGSILICGVVYLSYFKRLNSVKWLLSVLTIYPFFGYTILMMGSMVQKGIVINFENALDTDFSKFIKYYDFSGIIVEVMFALNVGTGLSFNLASSTAFRSPCYSNSVITIMISCGATILGTSINAMMTCPYAYQFGLKPGAVLIDKMSYTFEKVPRLLHAYQSTCLWLILIFSVIVSSALSLNILVISSLLEMLAKRKPCVARHPGFVAFGTVVTLFIVTIPLVSNYTYNSLMEFQRTFTLINVLMVIMENVVFVLWYGMGKFAEDIHFMQGTQPRVWVKICWLFSSVVLSYAFCEEVHYLCLKTYVSLGGIIGLWMFGGATVWVLAVPLLRLLVAAGRKRFKEMTRLDPTWGPKNEILQRSRAMFSAQAMTKEYMYRQYHLQAGIIHRQLQSNIRNPDFGKNRQST